MVWERDLPSLCSLFQVGDDCRQHLELLGCSLPRHVQLTILLRDARQSLTQCFRSEGGREGGRAATRCKTIVINPVFQEGRRERGREGTLIPRLSYTHTHTHTHPHLSCLLHLTYHGHNVVIVDGQVTVPPLPPPPSSCHSFLATSHHLVPVRETCVPGRMCVCVCMWVCVYVCVCMCVWWVGEICA